MFVLNPYVSDGRVRRTCRYLSSSGFDVVVIAESQSGVDDESDIDGVRVIRLASGGWPTSKGRFIKFMLRAAMRGAAIKAEIYHAFDLDALAPAVIASIWNRGSVVYEAHEYYVGLEALLGRPFTKMAWIIWEWLLIFIADRTITINNSIADKLRSRYGIQRPDVIYSCAENCNSKKNGLLRKRYDIQDQKLIALYTGILRKGQGLEILLEAFSEIESTELVIIGSGPMEDKLKEKWKMLKLERKVIFVGQVEYDELGDYYASADIGILLMEPEAENNRLALPNKFFAYLSAGLPVIVSDIPELRHFVGDYELGLVISPTKENTISAINNLASDKTLYQRCQANAVEFSSEFTWINEAEKYIRIYSELREG